MSVSAVAISGPSPRPVIAVSGPRKRYSTTSVSTCEVADHHGVVEDGHVGHAAFGMAGVEIVAEEGILV